MDVETLAREVEILRNQVEELCEIGAFGVEPKRLLEMMGSMLEELMVAREELRVQSRETAARCEELDQERRRSEEIWDAAPFGYAMTDAQGILLEANNAMGVFLGLKPERLVKKPLLLFVAEEERDAFRRRMLQIAEEGARLSTSWDARVVPASGRPVIATFWAVRVGKTAASAARLRWAIQDASDRRRREEELLAANHELERKLRAAALKDGERASRRVASR